jgi:hypothetical protein
MSRTQQQKPTPEQIARAIRTTMQILDSSTAYKLSEVLKIHGKLDIEKIVTMGQVALFEQELRVIFHSGANVFIRRLHEELKRPNVDDEETLDSTSSNSTSNSSTTSTSPKIKAIKLSSPTTGAAKPTRAK